MKKAILIMAAMVCSFIIFGTVAWADSSAHESVALVPASLETATGSSSLEPGDTVPIVTTDGRTNSKNSSSADNKDNNKADSKDNSKADNTDNETVAGKIDGEVYMAVHEILDDPMTQISSCQRLLLEACARIPAAEAGYCASWVSAVYSCLGVNVAGNANDLWARYCTDDDITNLVPGMMIAVEHCGTDHRSDGYIYGHVGIYLGDSKVIDSHTTTFLTSDQTTEVRGATAVVSLEDWLNTFDTYSTARWGFPDGFMDLLDIELLTSEPVIMYANLPAAEFMSAITGDDPLAEGTGNDRPAEGADDPLTADIIIVLPEAESSHVLPEAENAVCFTWTRVFGSDGYYVFRDDTLIAKILDNKQTYYVDTDRQPDDSCSYRIYSFKTKGGNKPVYLTRLADPKDSRADLDPADDEPEPVDAAESEPVDAAAVLAD